MPPQFGGNLNPGHIESIEFVPLEEVERRLDLNPDEFTETFPHVFRLFLAASVD
jgi:hypothetical protein